MGITHIYHNAISYTNETSGYLKPLHGNEKYLVTFCVEARYYWLVSNLFILLETIQLNPVEFEI